MGAGIVGVAVKRRLPDIVANPDKILTLKSGDHVLFKGVECFVECCKDSDEIWFTTANSRPTEYNAAMEEYLQGEMFAEGAHPNYRAYIKHIRMPQGVVLDELGLSTKRNHWGIGFHSHTRAVNTRDLFRQHIGDCEIS
jgi:hypothetical protein